MTVGNAIRNRLAAGDKLDLRLTLGGLRMLIEEQRAAGLRPVCVIVSETERRDLNDELMAASIEDVSPADANRNDAQIGFIMGVQIRSNPEVGPGKARIIHAAPGT